jgi:hypothetical protein
VLSSSSPTLLAPAHILQIVSAQKGLFSHWQAQINHVYPWVCIIELFARSQALFPRSNRFPMGGVEEASTLQTHNTSRLRFRDDPPSFR